MSPDTPSVDPPAGDVRRTGLAAALIVGATLAVYHNSFPGVLVFDDQATIIDNPTIRALWPPWAVLSPPAGAGVGGRPLANVTFALNHAVSGLQPWSYHAVNFALHALTALALFGVVRRTLLLPELRVRFGGAAWALALATAVGWAVHPVPTAAVDYVSQRTEILMALCYLLTLYGFVRAAEPRERIREAWPWATLAIAAGVGGMASKEVMVTAPVLVLLFDRTLVAGSFRAAWRARWWLHLALAATWLVLAHLLFWSRPSGRGIGFGLGVSWLDHALTQCRSILLYVRRALWPHPLVFDYGWDFVQAGATAAPFVLVLAGLLGVTAWVLWRRPAAGFALAAFFLVLAPTSSVVPIIQQPTAESRLYLPLAVLVSAAVVGAYALFGRRTMAGAIAIAVALGWGTLTVQRHGDYRSEIALWSDTVAKRPDSARAHGCLGAALLRAGRTEEALEPLQHALRLRPGYPEARRNLAAAFTRLGQARLRAGSTDEAIARFEEALRGHPGYAPAHNDLAVALLEAGRVADAVTHGTTAVRLDPDSADTHYNLGNALAQAGRPEDAIASFQAAVRLAPKFAPAYNNLGAVLLRTGRVAEAIAQFEAVLRLDPNHAGARRNLDHARTLPKP